MLERSASLRYLFTVAVFLLSPCGQRPAVAQSPVQAGNNAVITEERRQGAVIYPDTVSGTPLTNAGLIAGDKDKRAFINYTVRPGELFDLVFSASSPLSEQGRSTLTDLSGLTGKTRVGVQAHFGFHRLPTAKEAREIYDALWSECLRLLPAKPKTPSEIQKEKREKEETGMRERGCDFSELSSVDPTWFENVLKPYRNVSWFVTIKAETGPDSFSFIDPSSFADQKDRRWSHSASAAAGALLPSNVYLSIGLRRERSYSDAKTQAVCTIGDASMIACPSKVVGPPVEKTRGVIEGEARRFVGRHAGLSTILRYDWESGDTSLEVPVYLVQDKDGGFRGGVSYGHIWSEEAEASGHRFAVFVGQAFKLGG